jgi:A/G-specific adenine glycosylase
MPTDLDIERLNAWFVSEKRDFPWRKAISSYGVWISEVMLQQTRAEVVAPYFERWMAEFPTVQAVAEAPLEVVMKAWEGLGYYSRARAVHAAARMMVERHGGELPRERHLLEELDGFGPYTVGAVLSFAFHQREAAIDGNVRRVVCRYFGMRVATPEVLREKTEQFLAGDEPWVTMEALIELGARMCGRTPRCSACPLQGGCHAYSSGDFAFPTPPEKREKVKLLYREVEVVIHGGALLLRREDGDLVMKGLYEFPYVERGKESPWKGPREKIRDLPEVTHTFTKYRAVLFPAVWRAVDKEAPQGYSWIPYAEVRGLPFSSGHRKILGELRDEDFTH